MPGFEMQNTLQTAVHSILTFALSSIKKPVTTCCCRLLGSISVHQCSRLQHCIMLIWGSMAGECRGLGAFDVASLNRECSYKGATWCRIAFSLEDQMEREPSLEVLNYPHTGASTEWAVWASADWCGQRVTWAMLLNCQVFRCCCSVLCCDVLYTSMVL